VLGLTPELRLQVKISKLLGLAFAFSVVRLAGVGSMIALVLAIRAWRLSKHAEQSVEGKMLLWLSLVLGFLGSVILLPQTLIMIVRQLP